MYAIPTPGGGAQGSMIRPNGRAWKCRSSDHQVIADMEPVDLEHHEIEIVERARQPGLHLSRRTYGNEPEQSGIASTKTSDTRGGHRAFYLDWSAVGSVVAT